jgi:hypothetical protein
MSTTTTIDDYFYVNFFLPFSYLPVPVSWWQLFYYSNYTVVQKVFEPRARERGWLLEKLHFEPLSGGTQIMRRVFTGVGVENEARALNMNFSCQNIEN